MCNSFLIKNIPLVLKFPEGSMFQDLQQHDLTVHFYQVLILRHGF